MRKVGWDLHGSLWHLRNEPYFEGAENSTMPALAEWVMDSDRLLTF